MQTTLAPLLVGYNTPPIMAPDRNPMQVQALTKIRSAIESQARLTAKNVMMHELSGEKAPV